MFGASRERKDALAAAHERYAERRDQDARDAQGDDGRREAAETDVERAEDTAKALRRRRWWE